MAGLFEDIGEFFTGNAQRESKRKAEEDAGRFTGIGVDATRRGGEAIGQATGQLNTAQAQAQNAATRYGGAVDRSTGQDVAGTMAKANAAAQAQAGEAAGLGSQMSARQAIMAGRTAGLTRGAAALNAARGATDTYNQQYISDLGRGRDQYGQTLSQLIQQALAQQNLAQQASSSLGGIGQGQQALGLQALGAASNLNSAQGDRAQQSAQAGGGFLSGLISGAMKVVGGLG